MGFVISVGINTAIGQNLFFHLTVRIYLINSNRTQRIRHAGHYVMTVIFIIFHHAQWRYLFYQTVQRIIRILPSLPRAIRYCKEISRSIVSSARSNTLRCRSGNQVISAVISKKSLPAVAVRICHGTV